MKNIGNSILPSCSADILVPMGEFKVVRDEPADTHRLMRGDKIVASHPNGFSCHILGKHLAEGKKLKAKLQADYIVACGGTVDYTLL